MRSKNKRKKEEDVRRKDGEGQERWKDRKGEKKERQRQSRREKDKVILRHDEKLGPVPNHKKKETETSAKKLLNKRKTSHKGRASKNSL